MGGDKARRSLAGAGRARICLPSPFAVYAERTEREVVRAALEGLRSVSGEEQPAAAGRLAASEMQRATYPDAQHANVRSIMTIRLSNGKVVELRVCD